MIANNLIKTCVCGNKENFSREKIYGIDVILCENCKIYHQELINWTEKNLLSFYENDYHEKFQRMKGRITYQQSYDHDCSVANKRLDKYQKYLSKGMKGLDVGSSNSAFVHEARKRGLDCWGLEPGQNIGDNKVTIRDSIVSTTLDSDSFDFITMHDSIEHIVDAKTALANVSRILKKEGYLMLDLPDFWVKKGEHHWKYIEHLWFFTESQMTDILNNLGLDVVEIDRPIPGKIVFYAKKK
jgi:SAM-dependent methyltransferase